VAARGALTLAADVGHLQAGIGFLEDGDNLGFGESAFFMVGQVALTTEYSIYGRSHNGGSLQLGVECPRKLIHFL
jgi:hypothetical protein